jgi:DNA topoisomerase-1
MPRPSSVHRYSNDRDPGIRRVPHGDAFRYVDARGRAVRARSTLDRIAHLAIPPAWTDVWICADARGHVQATGRDARGRKQYRYHAAWVADRDRDKFDALLRFGRLLPRLRRRVARDLRPSAPARTAVIAAIVQLMDRVFIRVGSERYRRDNGSHGATTLLARHARVAGSEITLDFRGKSGKRHRLQLDDARVARVVRRCLDLPGESLFSYREGDAVRTVIAADVNAYLAGITGRSVTSKDFRTWGGSVCALEHLARCQDMSARSVREAVRRASERLGNTPAVCRRSYIHPTVLGAMPPFVQARAAGLRAGERMLVALLKASPPAHPPRVARLATRRGTALTESRAYPA